MAIFAGGIAGLGATAARGIKLGLGGMRSAAAKSGLVNSAGATQSSSSVRTSHRETSAGRETQAIESSTTTRKSPFLTPTGSRLASLTAAGVGWEAVQRGKKAQRKYLQ